LNSLLTLKASIFLPAGFHPPGADGYAMAPRPAGHDTLDPVALSFGPLGRKTHKSSTTCVVENFIDAFGNISDYGSTAAAQPRRY
jgi:hypothetical protein